MMEHRRYRRGDHRGDRAVRVRMTEHEHERPAVARAAQSGQDARGLREKYPVARGVAVIALRLRLSPLAVRRAPSWSAATEPHLTPTARPDTARPRWTGGTPTGGPCWRGLAGGQTRWQLLESLMQESSDSA